MVSTWSPKKGPQAAEGPGEACLKMENMVWIGQKHIKETYHAKAPSNTQANSGHPCHRRRGGDGPIRPGHRHSRRVWRPLLIFQTPKRGQIVDMQT